LAMAPGVLGLRPNESTADAPHGKENFARCGNESIKCNQNE
jgi:hypothetical protein